MCGRFVATQPPERLAEQFGIRDKPQTSLPANWNVAPTQQIYAVRAEGGDRVLDAMRWGFVPHWAKDPDSGPSPINARAETVSEKPMFKSAIRERRCLIPADGFFEWQKRPSGPKQPYFIRPRNGDLMAMAGIWSAWGDAGLRTCAILTTDPNKVVAPIHDRMPVLIAAGDWTEWLDPSNGDLDELSDLMKPSSVELEAVPISRRVNNPKFNEASLLEEVPEDG